MCYWFSAVSFIVYVSLFHRAFASMQFLEMLDFHGLCFIWSLRVDTRCPIAYLKFRL